MDGTLENWAWVDGHLNPADWATKPRVVSDLARDGFWQVGPAFLRKDFTEWPIKLDFRIDTLEGEISPKVHLAAFIGSIQEDVLLQLLDCVSSAQKLFRIVGYMTKWLPSSYRVRVPESKSAGELGHAHRLCVKLVQRKIDLDMQHSVGSSDGGKVHGQFKQLSPYLEEDGIWRVGSRMKEFTPFTKDNKPAAFLPYESRLTLLLIQKAHQKKHSGVEETVAQFRMLGYWTTNAPKLAKFVKSRCVTCRFLDRTAISQAMDSVPGSQLNNPVAWGHIELDLFGPFKCRSEVNKRASLKVWGMVIVDRNSGAVHSDIVTDYSAQETTKTLRRFASLRGWPVRIFSDPGSQLESSSGSLESWWSLMKNQLPEFASNEGFSWLVSPANSPWRQGRCEVRIKVLKKLITIAVGNARLSPTELQTVLFEAANLCNERPIGVHRIPKADGTFEVLTPNSLLIGRSLNKVPDDSQLAVHLKKSDRYSLIQQITSEFWKRWAEEVTLSQSFVKGGMRPVGICQLVI